MVTQLTIDALTIALEELLQGHGLPVAHHGGWLLPHGRLPGIKVEVTKGPEPGIWQFDFQLLLPGQRFLVESFAGSGVAELQAAQQALHAFCANSLHVLLAAFWHQETVDASDSAHREAWRIGDTTWNVTLGTYLTRRFTLGAPEVNIPDSLIDALRAQLERTCLAHEPHWVRVFYFNMPRGGVTAEVLLDNEPWHDGEAAIRALPWPKLTRYSTRTFFVISPSGTADADH